MMASGRRAIQLSVRGRGGLREQCVRGGLPERHHPEDRGGRQCHHSGGPGRKPRQRGRPGDVASFDGPAGIAVDGAGVLYVADTHNHTIRKLTPDGTVTTIVGLAGNNGYADGTNSAARFYHPQSLAVDSAGNLYVADTDNYVIRKLTPSGTNWIVSTLAGSAGNPGSGDGIGGAARFNSPRG